MHKCVNKSVGNIFHLEQLVGDFFPYSEEQLGFDKDITVVFQSDKDNSSKVLGKTAYYDPENFEIVLYVDGRHPKDIMRSLSHELVHHTQNCRGDFEGPGPTDVGYAQRDPHLRKMEREAYTKGNLIFRDYEDLIKTGKKEVDIDFSKSGEPKMSLKEWKNNEINMKLMKKWGFLKEGKDLEEGWGWRDEDDLDEAGVSYRHEEEGEGWGKDPEAFEPEGPERMAKARKAVTGRKLAPEGLGRKISVREAKQLTRRIIERVRKEARK